MSTSFECFYENRDMYETPPKMCIVLRESQATTVLLESWFSDVKKIKANKLSPTEVTRTAFNSLISKLSNNYLNKSKSKKFDNYVDKLYKGKVDYPDEISDEIDEITSSAIFSTNNGGRIYVIAAKNDDGTDSYYVSGTGKKIDDYFKEHFGRTFDLLMSTANILRRKKSKSKKELDMLGYGLDDEPTPIFRRKRSSKYRKKPIEIDDIDNDTESPKVPRKKTIKKTTKKTQEPKMNDKPVREYKSYGLTAISDLTFDNLFQNWGDGKTPETGEYKHGTSYDFKNQLSRKKFSNDWGIGYQYTLTNGSKIYMLKNHDKKDYVLLIFDGKESLNTAKKIGLFKNIGGKHKMKWMSADINKLREEI